MRYRTRLIVAVPVAVLAIVMAYFLRADNNPGDERIAANIFYAAAVVAALAVLIVMRRTMSSTTTAVAAVRNGFSSVGLTQLLTQLRPLLPEEWERPANTGELFAINISPRAFAVRSETDDDLGDIVLSLPTTRLFSIVPSTANRSTSGVDGAGLPALTFSFLGEEDSDADIQVTVAVVGGKDPKELAERFTLLTAMKR